MRKRLKKLLPALLILSTVFVLFCVSASAAELTDPMAMYFDGGASEVFIELLKTMFSVLGDCITSLMEAIKTGFMALVFVDPAAETLQISAVGIWIFVMLGLSLALSLGYYIIGILHRRG